MTKSNKKKSSRTVADIHKEAIEKYETEDNDYEDFPVYSKVKIIAPCVDFTFFYEETGVVIKNSRDYLGIRVKLDEPREYEDGTIITSFNFNPKDLFHLGMVTRFELMDLNDEI